MADHSFICNMCENYQVNGEKCSICNGQGIKWNPVNEEKYNEDPHEYMKQLILGCQ